MYSALVGEGQKRLMSKLGKVWEGSIIICVCVVKKPDTRC
jgi:hypothetical protein